LNSGNTAEAERLVIDLLGRFPRHLGALDLLYRIRRPQNQMAAAEALLKRIVRLDPNNLLATQTLALLLFDKGAMAEAEHHARNSVRLGPVDAQSHNLMGMVMTEANRPQPRLDADLGGGMTVSIGRIRACPVLTHKFVALGHNTIRGAAGASVLNAELMKAEGFLERLGA
jgi:tetratricopeptide (TPR) repeat protein